MQAPPPFARGLETRFLANPAIFCFFELTAWQFSCILNSEQVNKRYIRLINRRAGMNHCEVTTKYGSLRGERRKGVSTFRGIPYAKPPVGELR
ncbi:carboxylesterase family protein, partial [Enterocloster asparagiformis]|uniref:carboxylesterase family protein n=1 Tax=Enterocloster asparagiformis TaxID=333367 RepID=UPI002FE6F2C1